MCGYESTALYDGALFTIFKTAVLSNLPAYEVTGEKPSSGRINGIERITSFDNFFQISYLTVVLFSAVNAVESGPFNILLTLFGSSDIANVSLSLSTTISTP